MLNLRQAYRQGHSLGQPKNKKEGGISYRKEKREHRTLLCHAPELWQMFLLNPVSFLISPYPPLGEGVSNRAQEPSWATSEFLASQVVQFETRVCKCCGALAPWCCGEGQQACTWWCLGNNESNCSMLGINPQGNPSPIFLAHELVLRNLKLALQFLKIGLRATFCSSWSWVLSRNIYFWSKCKPQRTNSLCLCLPLSHTLG